MQYYEDFVTLVVKIFLNSVNKFNSLHYQIVIILLTLPRLCKVRIKVSKKIFKNFSQFFSTLLLFQNTVLILPFALQPSFKKHNKVNTEKEETTLLSDRPYRRTKRFGPAARIYYTYYIS